MSSAHDCKDCNERYNSCKCVKPPLGLLSKKIWQSIRAQDIREAVKRYRDVSMDFPVDWLLELMEIENGDN